MTHAAFLIWALCWPLVAAVDTYVAHRVNPDRGYGEKATASLMEFVIWGVVSWLLW